MKRVLMITSEESLGSGLETAAKREGVEFEHVEDWDAARNRLVDRPYEAVCVDYESVKIEGLNSFVQLDNILQKEDTHAVIVLRDPTPRASQFVETLESFSATVDLSKDTAADFRSELYHLLDAKPDPAESRAGATPDREVEVVLPEVSEGRLGEVSVARVVHTLCRQELTGQLELQNDDLSRRFEIADGSLLGGTPTFEKLQAAFAWSEGRYRFERDDTLRGSGDDPYEILWRGARNHLDQRDAMEGLTPVMENFIAYTDFFEDRAGGDATWADDEALSAFVRQADGKTTLEEALSAIASSVLTGFQAGFFAIECDLVALTDEPVSPPVVLTFSTPETSARQEASGGREGVSPTTPGGSDNEEPTTEEREAELRRTYERLSEADPYEVFDLWKGCGEENVRERYYKLVKRHHPDSYGGNISDEGKELAEEIFIEIKEAHADLLSAEGEQTVSQSEAMESTDSSTLDESLSSPSVTAMGDGTADETSRRSSDETPAATAMGAGGTASTDREKRRRYDSASTSNSADHAASTSNSDGRSEKFDRLQRNQSAKSQSRSQRKTPFKPEVRREKLDSLRQNPDKQKIDKVQNFERPETEDEAQEYFNAGYRAYKNENEAKAQTLLKRAYEFDSDNALWKTFYAYTLFLVDSEQRDRAEQLLREALDSDDRQARPDAHLFLGRILKVQDNHKQARRHFERALELDPDNIEAKRELRVYEMREGENSEGDDESGGFFDNLLNKDLF